MSYSDIKDVATDNFDAIILSGGHSFTIEGNDSRLNDEVEIIKNSTQPILGICYGFELIAHAFGTKLELLPAKEKGIITIEVVEPDRIFTNIPSFEVFENHRYVVKETTEDLIVLAQSKDGIEAIKHKTRPLYGVQFHPEMFVEQSCGDEIFDNFLRLV